MFTQKQFVDLRHFQRSGKRSTEITTQSVLVANEAF